MNERLGHAWNYKPIDDFTGRDLPPIDNNFTAPTHLEQGRNYDDGLA